MGVRRFGYYKLLSTKTKDTRLGVFCFAWRESVSRSHHGSLKQPQKRDSFCGLWNLEHERCAASPRRARQIGGRRVSISQTFTEEENEREKEIYHKVVLAAAYGAADRDGKAV